MKQRRKGLTLILMMLLLTLMPATALAQSITVTYQNNRSRKSSMTCAKRPVTSLST